MDGSYLNWHTEYDLYRLQQFMQDLHHGNPYKALRWRAKETELTEKLRYATFCGVRIWLPRQWLNIIAAQY